MGKWFVECFLVFLGYTAAYTFTLGFTYPVQKIILPDNSLMASILFLPHGVRAIALFLFGFRAIVYLLPAQYAMWYISVHGADIGLDLFSPLVSVLWWKSSCCTETYLYIGPFKDKNTCENVISYMNTKFFRFLVLLKKNTQNAMKGVYDFIPLQNFTGKISDKSLYKKYKLDKNEIQFIDSLVS